MRINIGKHMKLSIFKRTGTKKSSVKGLRYAGEIPAVLYGAHRKNENIAIKTADFNAIMRTLKPGRLPTTVFELHFDKDVHKALIREIQYHPTNYNILHIDFGIMEMDKPIMVNVPIILTGVAECAGVKLGGLLRQVIRTLKVSCLAKDMPKEFVIDVTNMNIEDEKRLSDIEVPKKVRPLGKMNEIAVVIAKRQA